MLLLNWMQTSSSWPRGAGHIFLGHTLSTHWARPAVFHFWSTQRCAPKKVVDQIFWIFLPYKKPEGCGQCQAHRQWAPSRWRVWQQHISCWRCSASWASSQLGGARLPWQTEHLDRGDLVAEFVVLHVCLKEFNVKSKEPVHWSDWTFSMLVHNLKAVVKASIISSVIHSLIQLPRLRHPSESVSKLQDDLVSDTHTLKAKWKVKRSESMILVVGHENWEEGSQQGTSSLILISYSPNSSTPELKGSEQESSLASLKLV